VATRAAFAAHRGEIDDLNVFPVPDGDTGTNLYITLDSALEAARETRGQLAGSDRAGAGALVQGTLAGDSATLARAALLAARGNSGVILSQLILGVSEVIAEAETARADVPGTSMPEGDGLDGPTLARALRRAADRAFACVTRPAVGTILTVAAAAAGAAEEAAAKDADLYDVAQASLAAARTALAATTAQLPILERAGVVDAGGLGYVLVLEALVQVVAGEAATGPSSEPAVALGSVALRAAAHADAVRGDAAHADAATADAASAAAHADAAHADAASADAAHADASQGVAAGVDPDEAGARESGPSYEVMYLLADSDEEAVSALRARLDSLGDSVLVVGGGDLWNVHAHVDDVGAAIQAGIEAGRPHRIVVTHFGDQQRARTTQSAESTSGPVAVVACAAGQGLAAVFCAAGAVSVFNGPGRRASAGQILDAIRSCGSRWVILLPNETGTQLAAEAAASAAAEEGLEVHVVQSRSAVQGIAALAVFEPTASGPDNLAAMRQAASATRYGAVTVAARESLTTAGLCYPGDVLGMVDGDVVVVGKDLAVVGADVMARLLTGGGELLTVIRGSGGGPELCAVVVASARKGGRDVEVSIIDGGQARYPLLLGVE
jgi:DAK2 domain fusion protein YloV